MVEDFQKKYDALKIEYPKDTLSSQIDSQGVQLKSQYEKFVADSVTRIAGHNAEKAKWEAIMPIEEMNREEAMDIVPHLLHHPGKEDAFWPHDARDEFLAWRKQIAEADETADHH